MRHLLQGFAVSTPISTGSIRLMLEKQNRSSMYINKRCHFLRKN